MRIAITNFKGMAPRIAPQLLPDGMAQIATAARLLSGDLEAWRDNDSLFALDKDDVGPINTIFPMDIDGTGPYWLHWGDDELAAGAVCVDVAKAPVIGDTQEKIYITGLAGGPAYTTLDAATGSPGDGSQGEYPFAVFPIGIDGPAEGDEPVTSVLAADNGGPDGEGLTLTNMGAEDETLTGWSWTGTLTTLSEIDDGPLTPAPIEGDRYFTGGTDPVTEVYSTPYSFNTAGIDVIRGELLQMQFQAANGPDDGEVTAGVRFYDSGDVDGNGFPTGTLLGDHTISLSASDLSSDWSLRNVVAPVPQDDATHLFVYMRFNKTGGANNDGYVDNIIITRSDVSRYYDCSDLEDWQTVLPDLTHSSVEVESLSPYENGFNPPVYALKGRGTATSSIYQELRTDQVDSGYLEFTIGRSSERQADLSVHLFATVAGAGTSWTMDGNGTRLTAHADWESRGVSKDAINNVGLKSDVGATNPGNHVFRVRLSFVKQDEDRAQVTAEIYVFDLLNSLGQNESPVLVQTDTFEVPINGPCLGFKAWRQDNGNNALTFIDDIRISLTEADVGDDGGIGSGDAGESSDKTVYVYTFVNSAGEESAPSNPSYPPVFKPGNGRTIRVTTATDSPPGFTAVAKRIYRVATGSNGSGYFFVDETPLAQGDYDDSKTDAQLGELLTTDDFESLPADAVNILSTANGIVFASRGNEILPSEQFQGYAFPSKYRLATDYPIVAMAEMDTDLIVATQAHPYIVVGSTPETLSMAKLEKPQGCVSKRSMIKIAGLGVVYASPDGLTRVTRGSIDVITSALFSRREWQALNPSSIHAVEHDGRYIGWYDNGTPAGFIFDPSPDGFGWIDLDFYAEAARSNPLSDELFLSIGGVLHKWNGDASLRPYKWRSKQFKLPHPASFGAADVRVKPEGSVQMRLYADGSATPFYDQAVTQSGEFVLPDTVCDDFIEIEMEGTKTVQRIAIGEGMGEVIL